MDELIELSLTSYQKRRLDDLFDGISIIAKKLNSGNGAISSDSEIDLFLLTNKEVLYQRLSNSNWKLCCRFFRSFIKSYKGYSEVLELPALEGCSISNQYELSIPTIKVGLISVKSKDRLVNLQEFWKKNRMFYSSDFIIEKIKSNYYCKIITCSKGKSVIKSKNHFNELNRHTDLVNLRILKDSQSYSRVKYMGSGKNMISGGAIGMGKKR